ncbi:MAG: ROK family protein [Nitrososphaeria archaeon]|nr:ROK family protein [Nitrososphaeria archaeon]
METAIGVDLGATHVRVAVGVKDGRILAKNVKKTVQQGDEYAVSRQIINMVRELPREFIEEAVEIVIGTIGPIDPRTGSISPANLPFKRVYLTNPISSELKLPVKMYNDCVAAVIGEKFFGEGRGVENLVYVTISSGIGGGIFVNNKLLLGKDGNAHEIGHMTIDFDGRLVCGCGKRGHWEAYCSGKNIPNFVRLMAKDFDKNVLEKSIVYSKLQSLDGKEIFDAARMGDQFSLKVVEEIGRLNAIGFANLINLYDPELIIVGGAVALNNREQILKPILEHVEEYTINRVPEIKFTKLGDEVGLYGTIAAAFYLKEE